MSPASSGALEVERYIGACLFTSQSRNKGTFSKPLLREHVYASRYVHHNNHHVQQSRTAVDGWAGGLPLISFANYQRRNNARLHDLQTQEARYPLSRLAVHTQGAPLILTNRYDHRKSKSAKTNSHGKHAPLDKKEFHGQNTDTVSVNSDESSCSANSENVLPRIIKPRKRRKKDRKPLHLERTIESNDCFTTDSGSPDSIDLSPSLMVNSYLPFSFEQYNISSFTKNVNDLLETPKLHHSFDEIQEFTKDMTSDNQTSSCQCRYCDPSGQIWDVDRNCYSPFLTTPEESQRSLFFPDLLVNTLTKGYDNSLSSSFLNGIENLSLEDNNSIKNYSPAVGSRRDLEVSTEIVTSLNGHRDLEIKFFSTPLVLDSTEKRLEDYSNRALIAKPVICK